MNPEVGPEIWTSDGKEVGEENLGGLASDGHSFLIFIVGQ